MKKKYLLNGKVYDEDTMNSYAQKSGLSLPDYLKESGAKEYTEAATYELNGKQYSSDTIKAYAKKSGLSFDGYINEAGVKKKEDTGTVPEGSSVDTAILPGFNKYGQPDISGGLIAGIEPEVSKIPEQYGKILDIVSQTRPSEKTQLYQKYTSDIESGDQSRIASAVADLKKLSVEKQSKDNPNIITPDDRLEIKTITGVDDPKEQLRILLEQRSQNEGRRIHSEAKPSGELPMKGLGLVSETANEKEPPFQYSRYIDKLAFQVYNKKDTTWSKKSVLTIGGKETTGLEDFLNLGNPSANAINYAKRFGAEGLSDSFSTGLESAEIKQHSPARYNRIVKALESGDPISTSDIVEITAIGAGVIDAKNSQAFIDGEKTPEEFDTEREGYVKDLEDNVYKHPDYLRSLISNAISKHYEKDGTVVFSKWMVTDKEIDAVPDSEYLSVGLDPNNPEFRKQKEFLKQKESWFPFQNAIAKDDLFREFKKGAIAPLEGILSTGESIISDDDQLKLDKQTEQLNISATANARGKYFQDNYGKWADAFNGLGQFASQLALMYTGSRALSAAGEALGGGTTASKLLGATQAEKLGTTLINGKNLYSQLGVPFIQSYGDYYKDALAKGANSLQAKMMAFTNASMEGVSETIFDNIEFGKRVAKNLFDKQNYSKIAKIFDRGVLDETAMQAYKENLQDVISGVWKATKKSATGAAKEAFEEVPVALTNFIVDAAANPANVEGRDVIGEMKDAFMNGLVSFSIPSVLGFGGSIKQELKNNKAPQEAMMIAAMDKPFVVEAINRMVEKGDLSQEEANKKIKVVNIAADQLAQLPTLYADDTELSPADREKYLSLSVREKIFEEQQKVGDKAVQVIAGRKIDEIIKQKEAILDNTKTDESSGKTQETLLTPEQAEENILSTLSEEKKTDAISFVNEMVEGEILPNTYSGAAKAAPLTFLQTVADQALGYTRDSDGNRVKSTDEVDPNVANLYSQTVVDYATELFPAAKTQASDVETKKAYDFDDTLFDNKTGALTPLGEKVKERIASGEDVKIITSRDAENTQQIKTQLGINDNNIIAVGDENKKGEAIDQLGISRSDYFDSDTNKLTAVQSGQPSSKASSVDEKQESNETTISQAATADQQSNIQASEAGQSNQTTGETIQPAETQLEQGAVSAGVAEVAENVTESETVSPQDPITATTQAVQATISPQVISPVVIQPSQTRTSTTTRSGVSVVTPEQENPEFTEEERQSFSDYLFDLADRLHKPSTKQKQQPTADNKVEKKEAKVETVSDEVVSAISEDIKQVVEENITSQELLDAKEELGVKTDEEVVLSVANAVAEDIQQVKPKVKRGSVVSRIVNRIKKIVATLFAAGALFTGISGFTRDIDGKLRFDVNKSIESAIKLLPQKQEEWAKRFLEKEGLYSSKDYQVEVVENIEETSIKIQDNKVQPKVEILAAVPDSYNTNDSLLVYRSTWNNKDGFEYVPGPNNSQSKDAKKVTGVIGVGHFLLDASLYDGKEYSHPNNKQFLEQAKKNNDYVPAFTRLGNGNVRVTYKRASDVKEGDIVISPLRQFKVSDIDWATVGPVKGFKSPIKEVKKKDGTGTYLLFKTKDGYSRFSGGSVVFIFNKNGNEIVIDYAGSVNMIQKESERIANDYAVSQNDITLGYHDLGSFSAKPKARDNVISSDQYSGYNNEAFTGGSLLIPLPPQPPISVSKQALSDKIFSIADKISKFDITGSDGIAAMSNLLKVPQELLAAAVRAVATAVRAGETFASAIKKGMAEFGDIEVDQGEFVKFVRTASQGEKPSAGTEFVSGFTVTADQIIPSDKEYAEAMNNAEPRDPIAAYHMTRGDDIPKAFGADLTQQNVFDSQPSEERFRTQMNMLQDGKSLMAAAQSMFGSTDVNVYGRPLFRYIQNMKGEDAGLTNKRAVMLATLLGEIKQAVLNGENSAIIDELRQLDRTVSSYYNRFMHVTAKNLSAARLLRLFRDKYMADVFVDKILEEQQQRERNATTEAESDQEVSDEDAVSHEDKGHKNEPKAQASARRNKKQKEADERKKGKNAEYEKRAKEKEEDIKNKYGSKQNLVNTIIDKIKKLNCK